MCCGLNYGSVRKAPSHLQIRKYLNRSTNTKAGRNVELLPAFCVANRSLSAAVPPHSAVRRSPVLSKTNCGAVFGQISARLFDAAGLLSKLSPYELEPTSISAEYQVSTTGMLSKSLAGSMSCSGPSFSGGVS